MRYALHRLAHGVLPQAGADQAGRRSGPGGLAPRHPRTREMLAPGLSVEGAGP